MTTKLEPKCSKKNLKKTESKIFVCPVVHICYFSEVDLAMKRTENFCFDCL